MLFFRYRLAALFATSTLLLSTPSTAFDSPLSDTAIREAYFLGQHHDEFFADFIQKYVVALPLPNSGPQIASVSLLTPYAVAAVYSNQQSGSYSAQQAQLDHDKQPEFVRVVVQIWLTESYGPYIVGPTGSRSDSPKGFTPRSPDFWREFRVRVIQKDQVLVPLNATGEPSFNCREDSSCLLSGATLTFDYPAAAFSQDTATVLVTPPEGDPVSVDFDLPSLR
jgi:hypothetical protein